MSSQNSPANDASIRKVQYAGPLPSYIPEDELQRLLNQSGALAAANKAPPPGFANSPAFPSSSANGVPGLSDVLTGQPAPSPNRGRQTSGERAPVMANRHNVHLMPYEAKVYSIRGFQLACHDAALAPMKASV